MSFIFIIHNIGVVWLRSFSFIRTFFYKNMRQENAQNFKLKTYPRLRKGEELVLDTAQVHGNNLFLAITEIEHNAIKFS